MWIREKERVVFYSSSGCEMQNTTTAQVCYTEKLTAAMGLQSQAGNEETLSQNNSTEQYRRILVTKDKPK